MSQDEHNWRCRCAECRIGRAVRLLHETSMRLDVAIALIRKGGCSYEDNLAELTLRDASSVIGRDLEEWFDGEPKRPSPPTLEDEGDEDDVEAAA